MEPIKTPETNITYTAEADEILDLPAVYEPSEVRISSTWELTELEREQIAEGGFIGLGVAAHQPPPAGLAVEPPFCPQCERRMEWSKEVRTFTCPEHVEDSPAAEVT